MRLAFFYSGCMRVSLLWAWVWKTFMNDRSSSGVSCSISLRLSE